MINLERFPCPVCLESPDMLPYGNGVCIECPECLLRSPVRENESDALDRWIDLRRALVGYQRQQERVMSYKTEIMIKLTSMIEAFSDPENHESPVNVVLDSVGRVGAISTLQHLQWWLDQNGVDVIHTTQDESNLGVLLVRGEIGHMVMDEAFSKFVGQALNLTVEFDNVTHMTDRKEFEECEVCIYVKRGDFC